MQIEISLANIPARKIHYASLTHHVSCETPFIICMFILPGLDRRCDTVN